MSSPTLIIGDGNWAVRSGSLLGYEYGELSGQFAPIPITGSRASIATYTDQSGLIVSASSDVLRVDYSTGTGSLLVEPQRTNSLRNSTMQGASASPSTFPTNWVATTGGLTLTVVGVGIENGLPYVDVQFSGIATSTSTILRFESTTQVVASNGQTWASSFWIKEIAAPMPPSSYQNYIQERDSGGTFLTTGNQAITISSTISRNIFTRTNTNASTARINNAVGGALTIDNTYDFTIRIAAPQLELGTFGTTWIPTTNTTVTRITDSFNRSNIYTDGVITSGGGTWLVELLNNVVMLRDASDVGLFIGNSSNGVTGDCLIIRNNGSNTRIVINKRIAGTQTSIYTTTTDTVKIAIKWDGTTADIFANGTKVVSATAFAATNMEFFRGLGADVTKYITQNKLYNQPLSDAECISLTTL
jgi:hypothetical protein